MAVEGNVQDHLQFNAVIINTKIRLIVPAQFFVFRTLQVVVLYKFLKDI